MLKNNDFSGFQQKLNLSANDPVGLNTLIRKKKSLKLFEILNNKLFRYRNL